MNTEPLNLINGKIITLNNSIPIAENITIKNGKIYSINQPNSSFKTLAIGARQFVVQEAFETILC